ncbi:IspD/TarI family cytidylyltransferase [Pseudonocardia alaniniphila]|uniref:IspD/TarI family cytidylyltransferase n=1 Tax=Pseudonocardia alaniniphila TaxID=75291 RepID=UPI0030B8915B
MPDQRSRAAPDQRGGAPAGRCGDTAAGQQGDAATGERGGVVAGHVGRAAAVVLAGGSGTRVGGESNKVYLPVAGRIMIGISLNTFAALPEIGPLVLVVRAEDRELADRVIDREVDAAVEVVTGGSTRQESELAGLRQLADRIRDGRIDTVLIHDGARPFAGRPLVREVLRVARECGGAVPGLPRDDLAAAGPGGSGLAGPAPEGLVAVQTPQGFSAAPLLAAYEQAAREGFAGTDTASCMQRFAPAVPIRWVAGDARNFKITYPHDLVLAQEVATPLFGDHEKV